MADAIRSLRDRVLAEAKSLPQPFLIPDVRTALADGTNATDIFHVLRDLWDEGIVSWSGSEGYRYAG